MTGRQVLPAEHVERVLSVMVSCGMYDYSGNWLYDVGIPAKSGVSGGIIAVVPGRFGIGIYSPLLDDKGNSVRGIAACKSLSRDLGLHAFTRTVSPAMALGRVYTGAVAPSRRQSPPEIRAYLNEHAHRIKYLCLHGMLAVDGAEYIIRRMSQMAADTHSFILDMHEVIGISESAAKLLSQARLGFGDDGIAVVCSRITERAAIMGPLRKAARKGDLGFLVFEDNDLAVEWCENRLLGELSQKSAAQRSLADSALFRGVPDLLLRQIEAATRAHVYAAGEQILRHGQQGDGRVFFIESGQVSILVPLRNGAHQRIATLGPGMEFGEMALLGQTTRSASVYANTEVRCLILEAGHFGDIADEAPSLKITVLENLASDMANRLRGANQWIAALA
jgi:glutaminase